MLQLIIYFYWLTEHSLQLHAFNCVNTYKSIWKRSQNWANAGKSAGISIARIPVNNNINEKVFIQICFYIQYFHTPLINDTYYFNTNIVKYLRFVGYSSDVNRKTELNAPVIPYFPIRTKNVARYPRAELSPTIWSQYDQYYSSTIFYFNFQVFWC